MTLQNVCKSLNYVRRQYNTFGERGNLIQVSTINDAHDITEDDKINVENIKCLLHMRDSYNNYMSSKIRNFTTGDFNTLLEFFCIKLK